MVRTICSYSIKILLRCKEKARGRTERMHFDASVHDRHFLLGIAVACPYTACMEDVIYVAASYALAAFAMGGLLLRALVRGRTVRRQLRRMADAPE